MFLKNHPSASKTTSRHFDSQRINAEVDIKVIHSKTWINYFETTPQQIKLRISQCPSTQEENELNSPCVLSAAGKYNFKEKSCQLDLCYKDFKWKLISITGFYVFGWKVIEGPDFSEVPSKNVQHGQVWTRSLKMDIRKVFRHILMKAFCVDICYSFINDKQQNLYRSRYFFDVPYFPTKTAIEFRYLGHFSPSKDMIALINAGFKPLASLSPSATLLLRQIDQYQRSNLTDRKNILGMLTCALNLEDLTNQVAFNAYSLMNVKLEQGVKNIYSFPIRKEQLPLNFKEMSLCLVPMKKYIEGKINDKDDCTFVKILKVDEEKLYFDVKFSSKADALKNQSKIDRDLSQKLHIRFIPNRITSRSCLQAIDCIKANGLGEFFEHFEVIPIKSQKNNGGLFEDFEWYNKKVATNEEQMIAIKNIVNCTAYPFPYVVYGPPGTGKTTLIVECIAQILKLKPNIRIIIAAQANSACDEIAVRVLRYVSWNKVFRYYSPSMRINSQDYDMPEILKRTSNLRNNTSEFPSKEEFKHFRVIITTLMSCSRLVQFDESSGLTEHFDYIFVDECASALEPESLVPIVGLGTNKDEISANIVLLGDHKQLGPIIQSDVAEKMGLGVSLLERVMTKRRYLPCPEHDNKFVVQLLDNFRSHPAILQFSNVLFYDSKLRAKITEPEKSLGTQWKCLNNKNFPILFHCATKPSEIKGNSSFNTGEVELVRFYVDLLLTAGINGVKITPNDIGIVSPYKAQLTLLSKAMKAAGDIEIGTAEYYQGREKKIIIISTVKSGINSVGFLKSEKRLNVCITRAKSLLILIGNGNTLQQNDLWNSFLHFCQANLACCGESFTLTKLTAEEQEVMNELNRVMLKDSTDPEETSRESKLNNLKAVQDRLEKLNLLMKTF